MNLRHLGNFLSGMETLVQNRFIIQLLDLGNFLSGMETPFPSGGSGPPRGLGNFLSGMETGVGVGFRRAQCSLETSLVEWKLETMRGIVGALNAPWKLP